MITTRDKLTFVHAMARSTRATVRQCEALMRYAGTLRQLKDVQHNAYYSIVDQRRDLAKRERIQERITTICMEIGGGYSVMPVFAGGRVKIRRRDGVGNSFGVDAGSGGTRAGMVEIEVPA